MFRIGCGIRGCAGRVGDVVKVVFRKTPQVHRACSHLVLVGGDFFYTMSDSIDARLGYSWLDRRSAWPAVSLVL